MKINLTIVEQKINVVTDDDEVTVITPSGISVQGPKGDPTTVGTPANGLAITGSVITLDADPKIIERTAYGSPQTEASLATALTNQRTRIFVQGIAGPVVNPSLVNGSGTKELYLFGTSDANTVELNSASNLLLSGKIILKLGTQLALHWIAGLNKWVEATRNEI